MASPRAHTLQDVADACGVTKMTVSRALRGQRGVAPALAEHIRATAEKLGYRANPAVGSVMKFLRKHRASDYRENLAFVWTHPSAKPQSLLIPWRDHARAHAEHLGYRLDEFFLRAPGMTSQRLREILQARGIRGILFAPDIAPPLPRVSFDVRGFAAVLLGSSLQNRGLARVQFDHFQLTHLALRHVRKAGYRRPALLLSPSFDGRSQGRLRAAYLAHSPAPVAERARLIHVGPLENQNAIADWLRQRRADAVLFVEDEPRKLWRSGAFRIPEELGVVSLSKHNDAAGTAGTVQSAEAIGHAAIDLVVAQLQRHEFGRLAFPQKVMLEATWSPGATLPRKAGTPAISRPASRLSTRR
jgi:DNA-binding LacI/PurR family transcriptional regulator